MITVQLKGGLGNQMFEYAAAIGAAKRLGVSLADIKIDTVYLDDRWPRPGFAYRKLDLDVFGIDGPLTNLSSISQKISFPGGWLALDVLSTKARSYLGKTRILNEGNILNCGLPAGSHHSSANYYLNDYFQSEKYFEGAQGEVRKAFSFRLSPEPKVQEILREINSCESVSVHIRRGDYLNPRNAPIFYAQDENYYHRAIEGIYRQIPDAKFFIFSDDADWCLKHFSFLGDNVTYVAGDKETSGYKASGHLRLMSACKGHIIGNSTYSWWGAWLDPDSKITIAPKDWYKDPVKNSGDLVPASWVRI